MKTRVLNFVVLALAGMGLTLAQQPAQQPAQPPAAAGSPVAQQPRVKTPKEGQAIQAIFATQEPDARIAAAKELITKFADTEFKALAYTVMAMSYQQKGDQDNMILAYEEVLKVDPQNFAAMVTIAGALAQRTKEFDLDKEEKLGRAEKLAKDAQAAIKTAPRPRPDITDEQWTAAKKDYDSQAYESLGLIAMARKKNADAITNFKAAVEIAAQPDPATMVRLAAVYDMENKPDEAIAILDKVLAMPDLHPTIKQFAQTEKMSATKLKNAKPAAAPKP